jgi:UDP:flavonoid glycosyltransferase YjiC (YdhE family)
MRMLFTSTAGLGHLLPLLPIAQAALQAGHDVSVATAPRHGERLVTLGLGWFPLGQPSEQERRAVHDPQDPEAGPTAMFGRLNPSAALPAMRSIVDSWRPDVVVSEAAEFSGGMVAGLHRLPTIRVHPGLAGVGLFESHVASSLSQIRTQLGLPADPDARLLGVGPQVSYFPAAFDPPGNGSRQIVRIRATEASTTVKERRPAGYVTFGTEIVGMPFFGDLARDAVDAVQATGLEAILSIADADPTALGDLGRTRIERWIDQTDLLPRVRVVICHGGSGTTLGALAAGTPIIAVPVFADQPFNAERITATKTGLAVPLGDQLAERLGLALQEILAHPPIGSAQLADAIRALPGPDAVLSLAAELSA